MLALNATEMNGSILFAMPALTVFAAQDYKVAYNNTLP